MVNNQQKKYKKDRSLAGEKTLLKKKKLGLNQVLRGRPRHGSTRRVYRVFLSFCLP